MKAITTHYIDGAFVESHGQEVMDIIRPTDGQVIARVTLGDEEDTRRAIGAARRRDRQFAVQAGIRRIGVGWHGGETIEGPAQDYHDEAR